MNQFFPPGRLSAVSVATSLTTNNLSDYTVFDEVVVRVASAILYS